jgi:hypothetical protein
MYPVEAGARRGEDDGWEKTAHKIVFWLFWW